MSRATPVVSLEYLVDISVHVQFDEFRRLYYVDTVEHGE